LQFDVHFGDDFERVTVHASGAIVATARQGASYFLRRNDGAGNLQWSSPLGGIGCHVLVADPAERVGCLRHDGVIVFSAEGAVAWGPIANDGNRVSDAAFDSAGRLWSWAATATRGLAGRW
jgi:hypothetical protein